MIAAPRRRFSLSDILILVAATALSFVMVRYIVALNLQDIPGASISLLATNLASPVLVALSLATFVIGLRQPRLPLRRLARDPGFVAMSVVVLTTVYFLVHLTMRVIANYNADPPLFSTHIVWFLSNMFYSLGWNIAIAWFVLALQGQWRIRAIRNGGLAAVLGGIWIVIWILTDLRQFARMISINYF